MTVPYFKSSSYGLLETGKFGQMWIPNPKRGSNKCLAVLLHGRNAPYQYDDYAAFASHSIGPYLAMAGIPAISTELGDNIWANDTAMGLIDSSVAAAKSVLGITAPKICIVGTSMGGMIAMGMAQADAWPIAAVVLNDIGPDLEPAGIERIRDYVGQGGSFETWMHAARHLREQTGGAHPDFTISDWLAFAKRVMVIGGNGRIAFDYDMKIAEPLQAADGGVPDLWPFYRALEGRPVLVLRGELSDLLSAATVTRMQAELPGLKAVIVPRVGHPPTLAEPAAQQAIADLLAEAS